MTTFTVPTKTSRAKMDLNTTSNLVDPEWELIDPIPDIHNLFITFNNKFFKGALACVELEWSKKMYQCAGICYSKKSRGCMSCIIRLSEPLLKLRSRKELIETLLHEMIHAWNFIRGILEENGGHGKNFLSKMHEINSVAGTNITVYHTFHDEVELYKKHWWRCDGVCKDRKPFYGFVKRTSNRAPGPNDFWWKQHLQTCGGKFIKVKEPEKTEKKKAVKKKDNNAKKVKTLGNTSDIRKFFPNSSQDSSIDYGDSDDLITDDFGNVISEGGPSTSSGNGGHILGGKDKGVSRLLDNDMKNNLPVDGGKKLGGSSNGRSRLLDMFDNQKKKDISNDKKRKLDESSSVIVIGSPPSFPVRKSFHKTIRDEFDDFDDDDVIFIDDEFDDSLGFPNKIEDTKAGESSKEASTTCHCPICNLAVEISQINNHLDECLTLQSLKS